MAAARLLLDSGADVGKHSPMGGDIPLHRAIMSGNVEFVELLLSREIMVNVPFGLGGPKYWKTPLQIVVEARMKR
ncbi:ankyrin repeat domain-containing protein [bacterium]|nr:ankyrin repeat domain-containing protein [bacterium]